jgi:hypothetical protein
MNASGSLLREYLQSATNNLAVNLRLYTAGETDCYRVVALQLRLLLCDTTRVHGRSVDSALISRACVDLKLPPMVQDRPGGRLSLVSCAELLSLKDWLGQALTLPDGERLSVRQFIRIICEQDGGAHVDQRPGRGLRGWPERAEVIAALGRCLLTAMQAAQQS